MKNRAAFSLQTFMVIYNLGLVALSIYMFVEVCLIGVLLSWALAHLSVVFVKVQNIYVSFLCELLIQIYKEHTVHFIFHF